MSCEDCQGVLVDPFEDRKCATCRLKHTRGAAGAAILLQDLDKAEIAEKVRIVGVCDNILKRYSRAEASQEVTR